MNKPQYTCDELPTCQKQLKICKEIITDLLERTEQHIGWVNREIKEILRDNGLGDLIP